MHGVVRPCLTQLAQLRLRLLQPVCHVHFAIHRGRDSEVLLSLLGMQFAEAQVAVGDEWADAAWLGDCQRLAVVTLATLLLEVLIRGISS